MPLDVADAQLDAQNPWPGLLSFTEGGQAFFHGRDADVAELLRLVQRQTLTVLFGQSGLGKTSLLNAGLFPRLRELEFLPVYIRLDLHDASVPPLGQVWATLAAQLAEHRIEARAPEPGETLWGYFHDRATEFWDARSRLITPVLVFDQFEEVFTLGGGFAGGLQDLLDQLAELVENRIPASVRQALEADPDSAARFDFGRAGCKVILSFREDFLPQFEGLRRLMPSSAGDRLRLRRMTGLQAREAILLAGGHLLADEVADRIIAFVAGERRAEPDAGPPTAAELARMEVDPALLSLVCRQLNNKRRAAGLAQITEDLLADESEEIIADFYHTSIADLGDPVRRFIEDHLLTSEGFRNTYPWADALLIPGVTESALNALVGRRLLRVEEYSRARRIELAHDVLTRVIREERDQRRAGEEARSRAEQAEAEARREREEREAQAHLAQEALARERAANRQTQLSRAIAVCAVLLAVACVALLIWSRREQQIAEAARAFAVEQTGIAQRQTRKANEQAAAAESATRMAEEQTRKADEAARAAEMARADAAEKSRLAEQNFRSALAVVGANVKILSDNFEAGRISTELARNLAESARIPLANLPIETLDPDALRILMRLSSQLVEIYDRIALPAAMLQSAQAEQEAAERLAARVPGDSEAEEERFEALVNVSEAESSGGDVGSGIEKAERALRLAEAAAAPGEEAAKAKLARAQIVLGFARFEECDLPEALEAARAGLRTFEELAAHDDGWQRATAFTHGLVARIQFARGDLTAAQTEWTAADDLLRATTGKYSVTPAQERSQIDIDYGLASISIVHGNFKAARLRIQSHSTQLGNRLEQDNQDMDWQETAMRFFIVSGDLDRTGGDLDAARKAYDIYGKYARQWASAEHPYVHWPMLSIQHDLDVAALDLRRDWLEDALSLYQRAAATASDLAGKHPSYVAASEARALAQLGIGDVAAAHGQPEEAWAAYQDGLAILRPLVRAHPDDAAWQHDLALAESKAAEIRVALDDPAQAVQLWDEAISAMSALTTLDKLNLTWRDELRDMSRRREAAKAAVN